MLILLGIGVALVIALTVYQYIKTTAKSDRGAFSSLSTLLQTVFVFVTLYITILTIHSSNSDTQQMFQNLESFGNQFSKMESSLDDVSNKLKEMPKQIENFGTSIRDGFPLGKNVELIAAGSEIIIPCVIRRNKMSEGVIYFRIDYFSKYISGSANGELLIK